MASSSEERVELTEERELLGLRDTGGQVVRAASPNLKKAMGKLGDGLTKKQMKAVEELSRGIVNKLLHGPMQALRSDGTDPAQVSQTLVNMHALEDMFDLKNDGVPGSRNGKK